ncbi:zinc finger, CCHC-type containing protein [Tanacetum coccineum]
MNNSVTIAYRFEITLQLCLFDGSKPKNNDELQPRLSNFFKNFDSNGGDDLCYQDGLDQRTTKLRKDILMFQQYQGESLSEAWTRFKDLLQKVPHHGIDRWFQIQFFYDHVSFHLKCEIDRAAGRKLHDKNADES